MILSMRGALAAGTLLALAGPALALDIVGEPAAAPAAANAAATAAQVQIEQLRPQTPAADFAVTAWVDRPDLTYAIGDTLTLWVRPSADAYVTVYSLTTGGDPVRIFPNDRVQDNFLRAGEVREVGHPGEFTIRVGGPVGPELIKVIASERPIESGSPLGSRSLSIEAPALAQTLQSSFSQANGKWATHETVIRIVDRPAQPPAQPPVGAWGPVSDLRLSVERDFYRIGEDLVARVSAEQDCHLTLTSFGADGQAVQLFPNAYQPNGFVHGGDTLILPGDMAAYRFSIEGPVGPETLLAQCHDMPQAFSAANGAAFSEQGDWSQAVNRAAVRPAGQGSAPRRAVVSYFVSQ